MRMAYDPTWSDGNVASGHPRWAVYDQSEGFQPAYALVFEANETDAADAAEELTNGRLDSNSETVVVVPFDGIEPERRTYAIHAVLVLCERKAGWQSTEQLPTFFLAADLQGIVSEDHAVKIARDMIDTLTAGRSDIDSVHVSAFQS
jgi:hypothetical protein